jgi:hypothetical protein
MEEIHSNIIDGVGLADINQNINNIIGPDDEERCPLYGAVISATISDDKHHDTYFVEHFIKSTMFGADGWWYSQDDWTRNISEFHIHSDGAASHFKQRRSLLLVHWILQNVPAFRRVTWGFGCPGHGKGVWDGLGGTLKNTLLRYLLAENIVVNSIRQLYEIVVKLFDKNMSKTERWVLNFVLAANTTDLLRPRSDAQYMETSVKLKAFEHGAGTQSIFMYEAMGPMAAVEGEPCYHLAYRLQSCWCPYCVRCLREDTPTDVQFYTPKKKISARDPYIIGCLSNEPWASQMVYMHSETNTKYKAPRDNVPAVGEEQAQPEGEVDESAAQHDEGIPVFDQAAAEAMLMLAGL